MIIKQEQFSAWVETSRAETKENYIDTVLLGCEEFSIETELVAPLLTQQIVAKIKAEAIEMRYFKTNSTSLKAFL